MLFKSIGNFVGSITAPAFNQCFALSSVLGDAVKQLQDLIGKTGPQTNSMASLMGPSSEQLLYVATLQAAIEKATRSQSFNIETQVNDLWIKLNNVRSQKPKFDELNRLLKSQQDMVNALQSLMLRLNRTSQQTIQNLTN